MGTLNVVGVYVGNSNTRSIPQQLGAILYIPDLNTPVNGYWQDKSGKGKLVQAATTTVANDSLIMPANDADIIAALTLAGAYSKYYTNNSTPKKVLVSQVASIDSKYAVFFDAKTKTKFSLFKTQGDETRADKMYEYTFKAYTGGYFPITQTSDSVSFVIRGTGTHVFDWGDGTTTSYTLTTGADTTVSHTWTTNLGGQKNISVTGNVKNWTRLVQLSRSSDNNIIRITGMSLTYITLYNCPNIYITGAITGMALTYLSLYNCPNIYITGAITGMALTYLLLSVCPNIYITGAITGMALTYLQLNVCPNINITGAITGMALTYLLLYNCPNINITGAITGMALTYLLLYNCPNIYITGAITGMALTYLLLYNCPNIYITGAITGMALTYLQLNVCPNINITGAITGMSLTYITLYNCPNIYITGAITGMALMYLLLYNCPNIYITGAITGMALTYLQLNTCPLVTITGAIETCTVATTRIDIQQPGITYGGGTTKAWNISQTVQAGWTSAMVDAWFNAYALTAPTVTSKTLNLAGTNQAPTAASAAARTTLTGKGFIIIINS